MAQVNGPDLIILYAVKAVDETLHGLRDKQGNDHDDGDHDGNRVELW